MTRVSGSSFYPMMWPANRAIQTRYFWNFCKRRMKAWPGSRIGIVTRWNVSSFPTVYLIDAKGVIRSKDPDDDELEKSIAEAVQGAERK